MYIPDTTTFATTTTAQPTTTTKKTATQPTTTIKVKRTTQRTTTLNGISKKSTNLESETLTSALLISIQTKQKTHTSGPSTKNTKASVANEKGRTKFN